MGNYSTPFPTVIDAVIKALEQALPERVPGGHFGTHSGVRFYRQTAGRDAFSDPRQRPWRLGRLRDAMTAQARSAPWRTATRALFRSSCRNPRCRSGSRNSRCARIPRGAGTFRGGLGFRKNYRILAPCTVQTNLDRTKFPPWGVQGGARSQARALHPGRRADCAGTTIDRQGEGPRAQAGDLLCVETGGGGGYGPPASVRSTAIQRDLDAGYVSREGAERDYGVTIGADGKARAIRVAEMNRPEHGRRLRRRDRHNKQAITIMAVLRDASV